MFKHTSNARFHYHKHGRYTSIVPTYFHHCSQLLHVQHSLTPLMKLAERVQVLHAPIAHPPSHSHLRCYLLIETVNFPSVLLAAVRADLRLISRATEWMLPLRQSKAKRPSSRRRVALIQRERCKEMPTPTEIQLYILSFNLTPRFVTLS